MVLLYLVTCHKIPRVTGPPFSIVLKVTNLNLDELLTGARQEKLLDVVTRDLWGGTGTLSTIRHQDSAIYQVSCPCTLSHVTLAQARQSGQVSCPCTLSHVSLAQARQSGAPLRTDSCKVVTFLVALPLIKSRTRKTSFYLSVLF